MNLKSKKCKGCDENEASLLSPEEVLRLLNEIPGWDISTDGASIVRSFEFKTFIKSIEFINQVADISEIEGHHPDIHCFYDRVRLEISTHSVSGLTEDDFILASKIDGMLL